MSAGVNYRFELRTAGAINWPLILRSLRKQTSLLFWFEAMEWARGFLWSRM